MEAVRLVIWDLDETFWTGTLTEGGIKEYVREHHDIVIELARRGIMSSICSKNDFATVRDILVAKDIFDYFIFPSISWETKGFRVQGIIDKTGLRPATVMFIDDNPNNRAEIETLVPGVQVESEAFIARMLADERFRGKDDHDLSRLKQYKVLERRSIDQQKTGESNEDFLRSANIRVLIDYNVEEHIDRAIELINRTNQLNYTKKRLPEDVAAARAELLAQMSGFDRRCGLVRVVDDYGDYGYVGFFLLGALRSQLEAGKANTKLFHFCFSCRTLGMLVEQWVYNLLGQPELRVVGDVLTDLAVERDIDWIRQIFQLESTEDPRTQIAPQITVFGGCEAHILGTYLGSYTPRLQVFGNYATNGFFLRINCYANVLDICDRDPQTFQPEAELLGLPTSLEMNDFFAAAPEGTVFVFNLALDAGRSANRIRHRKRRWVLSIEPRTGPAWNFAKMTEKQLLAHLDARGAAYDADERTHVLTAAAHLRRNYEPMPPEDDASIVKGTRSLLERVPAGGKVILIVDHDKWRPNYPSPELGDLPNNRRYLDLIRPLAVEFPFVGICAFSDSIKDVNDLGAGNHYARKVYLRFVERIVDTARMLEGRRLEETKKNAPEAVSPPPCCFHTAAGHRVA